jgi:hypothetical protein
MSDPSPDECESIQEGWKLMKSGNWRSTFWINKFVEKNETQLVSHGFEKGLRVSANGRTENFRERVDGMLGILELIIETQVPREKRLRLDAEY